MAQSTAGMTAPTYAYHPDVPEGRIFDLDDPEHVEELETGGWVDSPAKLVDPEPEPDSPPEPADLSGKTKDELIALAAEVEAEVSPSMTKADMIAAIEAVTVSAE